MAREKIAGWFDARLTLLLGIVLIASACATPSGVEPSPGPWRFTGSVSALDEGRVAGPIPGAHLTVVNGVNENVQVTSDASGRFAFDALTGDRFALVIEAPGYVSVTPTVHLFRDVDVNFGLRPR